MTGNDLRRRREALNLGREYFIKRVSAIDPEFTFSTIEFLEDPQVGQFNVLKDSFARAAEAVLLAEEKKRR